MSEQLALIQTETFEERVQMKIASAMKDEGPFKLSWEQRRILTELRFHCGHKRAIVLTELMERVYGKGSAVRHDREIKDAIRSLVVDFGIPIGAERSQKHPGYYLVSTPEEAQRAASVYFSEARELLRRARVFVGPSVMAELLGQLNLERKE